MGYYEALRRSLSRIFGREVQEDDPALFQLYTKSTMPAAGATPFKHFGVSPNTTPPGVCFDSNGAVRYMLNTSGAITEASAAGISSVAANTFFQNFALVPHIANYTNTQTDLIYRARRIGRAVASVAGGAFANLSLVPALAGYYGVVEIIGVITDIASVGAQLTFESPAATPALPSVFINTYGANVINRDLEGVVVSHATLVDNQAIVVDGAGFGASTFCIVLYTYHYET